MHEIFLTTFILMIGVRAALSIPKYPRYSRGWVLRSLLMVGLYIVYSFWGMILIVKVVPWVFPADLSEDQTGLVFLGAWILWMTVGTIGLIRMDRRYVSPARASQNGPKADGA